MKRLVSRERLLRCVAAVAEFRLLLGGLLVLWALGLAVPAWADSAGSGAGSAPRDAFIYSSQSFFQAYRFAFEHEDPRIAPVGTVTATLGTTWSNTWIFDQNRLEIDAETVFVRPQVAYVPADDLELSLRVPYIRIGRGRLDGLIDNFHRALGLTDELRHAAPRYQLRLAFGQGGFSTPNTVVLNNGSGATTRLAPVATVRWRVTERGAAWPVALTAAVDFPTLQDSNPIVAGNGHDMALGVAVARAQTSGLRGMASLAVTRTRSGRLVGFENTAREVGSAMASLELPLSARHSLLAEMLMESATAWHSGTGFDRRASEVLLGWKGEPWPGTMLEAALVENVFTFANDMDVGFHFAFSTRL